VLLLEVEEEMQTEMQESVKKSLLQIMKTTKIVQQGF
jgi:hypothetical protein